jgi:hypothetical protein
MPSLYDALPVLEEPFLDAAAVLRQWGFAQGTEPFLDRWEQRNPWNIPGPLFVADDDACGVGPVSAPNNVHLEGSEGEFVFRQPTTQYELRQVVEAALANPVSAYGCDGNERWTPQSVAAWWESIQPVRQRLRKSASEYDEESRRYWKAVNEGQRSSKLDAEWKRLEEKRPSPPLRRWLDYLDHGTETYLRRYMFFLATGRVPAVDERMLPDLMPRR